MHNGVSTETPPIYQTDRQTAFFSLSISTLSYYLSVCGAIGMYLSAAHTLKVPSTIQLDSI